MICKLNNEKLFNQEVVIDLFFSLIANDDNSYNQWTGFYYSLSQAK